MPQTVPMDIFAGNPIPSGPKPSPTPEGEVFKLRGANGKIYPIRASSPEDAFSILDEIEAGEAQPKDKGPQGYLANAWEAIKGIPAGMVQGAWNEVLEPSGRHLREGVESFKRGDPLLGATQMIASIPGAEYGADLSRKASAALRDASQGNVSSAVVNASQALPMGQSVNAAQHRFYDRAVEQFADDPSINVATNPLGELHGTLAAYAVPEAAVRAAPGAIKAAPGAVKAATPALKEAAAMAKDAALTDIRAYRPNAVEYAAAAAAGLAGGSTAAGAVYALMKIPRVLKSVAKGRAARRAISEAKAQGEILKMGEDALQREILTQNMDKGTGLPLNPDGTVTVKIGGREINLDPSRIEPKVKPIPPSRLKPDIPDPVVPETAPKPAIDRGKPKAEFEARKVDKPAPKPPERPKEATTDLEGALKASLKGDVVYAPPAFKGQQSAGATKARFEMVAERNKPVPMSEIEKVSANVSKWVEGGTKPSVIQSRLNSIFKGKRKFSAEDVDVLIKLAKEK